MIYGEKFLNNNFEYNELVVESELNNINKIIQSFDVVNENAQDIFKKIVDKAKEVLAKILDVISKVFKKFIPKLYEALQKIVNKLRSDKSLKLSEKHTIVYYTWTDTYHKYKENIEKYCDLADNYYSDIINIYTYSDPSKELAKAQETKKKMDTINEEIIKLAGISGSSSTSDFENKMINKTEEEIDAGASSDEIMKKVAKIDGLIFDVKQSIANVNEFYKWVKKVKDDVEELVKSESFKAFDNKMKSSDPIVIGDVSYGDIKLLQAMGLQETTRILMGHLTRASHILNTYLKNNLQAYKSVCGLIKNQESYKEYINYLYLDDTGE